MVGVQRMATKEERRRVLFNNLHEVKGESLRVCESSPSGQVYNWRYTSRYIQHGYRNVLPCEVVFDMDVDDWDACVDHTHLLWDILNEHDIPYWGALSGGSGTHTHVFIDEEYREEFVDSVVSIALGKLNGGSIFDHLDRELTEVFTEFGHDEHLLHPDKNSQAIRAFGAKKRFTKTLWTEGPGNYKPVSLSRPKAYAIADTRIPTRPPEVEREDIASVLRATRDDPGGVKEPPNK